MIKRAARILRKSGLSQSAIPIEPLDLKAPCLGQSCPHQCPQATAAIKPLISDPLGAPLTIREAARIIGCSPWTVRQRYLHAGLPHHRTTPNGKLIFYRNQIVRWLLRQQQKGEMAL